jgi:hypothetical protein
VDPDRSRSGRVPSQRWLESGESSVDKTPGAATARSGHEALASPGRARPHIPRRARDGWLRGQRWTWIGSGVWPVRPSLTSNVITARPSADLKRPPLGVVLDLPFVAADYAEQVSHGSPTSASVWMALTLHGSGSLDMFTSDKTPVPKGLGHQGFSSFQWLQSSRLVLCESYSGASHDGGDLASCGRKSRRGCHRRC